MSTPSIYFIFFSHTGDCDATMMTACSDIDQPLLRKSAKIILVWPRQRNSCYSVAFSLLLLWQLVGAILYMIRDVACFSVQSTAYQCKKEAAFPFSEELTIVWLASLCIFTAIFIAALRDVPQFLGYKAILYQLMFVPSFLTLVLLLTLALCRYINLLISIESSSSRVIIFFLIVSYILRTLAVGFLNYTKLNFLKQSDPIYVFVIYKITVFVFFVVTLINLMATLLAVSVKIHEMHRAYTDKNSLDMDTINTLLAVFGTTTFRISLMSFFWEKLFTDDRNILCNHIPLE